MRTASRHRVSLIVPSVFMGCSSPGLMKSGKPVPEPGINRDVCQESGTSRGVIAPGPERPAAFLTRSQHRVIFQPAPRGRPTVRVKGSTRPLLFADNLLFLAPTADDGRKERRCVMSEPASPAPLSLPDSPSLDWLRKQAKRRLGELRKSNPAARLADAQFDLARQYGGDPTPSRGLTGSRGGRAPPPASRRRSAHPGQQARQRSDRLGLLLRTARDRRDPRGARCIPRSLSESGALLIAAEDAPERQGDENDAHEHLQVRRELGIPLLRNDVSVAQGGDRHRAEMEAVEPHGESILRLEVERWLPCDGLPQDRFGARRTRARIF